GGMRLQQSFLQVQPQFRSAGRSCSQGRKRLLDAVLGSRTEFQAVMGHEMEQTQQYFRILQGGRLLQKDETIDHRKVSCSQPRTPALYLAIQSRPCLWNLFEQLRDRTLHGAG